MVSVPWTVVTRDVKNHEMHFFLYQHNITVIKGSVALFCCGNYINLIYLLVASVHNNWAVSEANQTSLGLLLKEM